MAVEGRNSANYPFQDGGIMDRAARGLLLEFSRPLAHPVSAGWFTVTDSHGNNPGWELIRYSGYGSNVDFAIKDPLPAGETYTMVIKGGPEGLRDMDGNRLESDLTITLRTETQFGFLTTYVWGDFPTEEAKNGAVLDRGLSALHLQFSTSVGAESVAGNVKVTNAKGETLPWQSSGGGYLVLQTGGALQAPETYTVRIKGGPDGLKSVLGDALAEDAVYQFTTEERPTKVIGIPYRVFDDQGIHKAEAVNGVISRVTNEVEIRLNRRLNLQTVPGSISVTDSQGQAVAWKVESYQDQPIKLTIPDNGYHAGRALPKRAAYTVRIKGGPDGLRSQTGVTLSEDMLITLRTDDRPARLRAWNGGYYPQNQLGQTEVYELSAAAGPLKIQTAPTGGPVEVVLQNADTEEVVLDKVYDPAHIEETVTLPADGTYWLILSPNRVEYLGVEATELQMSTVMPGVRLPAMKRYETRNEPFTFQPELLDPKKADSVQITINGHLVKENALRSDGTIEPVAVDPAAMDDGPYVLRVTAFGTGNGNLAQNSRAFLVDRFDTFTDVPVSHWARRYIEFMAHLKIINGRAPGLFVPADPVTRAEFAKMLALTLELEVGGDEPSPFVDVPDGWAKPYVQAVYTAGLMQGEEIGGQRYFSPNRTITRAEAATVVGRALGVDKTDISGRTPPFADFDTVPVWARPSVLVLADAGWLNGFPDGNYYPMRTLQRDQAARLLTRFYGVE